MKGKKFNKYSPQSENIMREHLHVQVNSLWMFGVDSVWSVFILSFISNRNIKVINKESTEKSELLCLSYWETRCCLEKKEPPEVFKKMRALYMP